MTRRVTISFLLAAALVLSSCVKESREAMYASQETKIESFVKSQTASKPDARVEYNGGSTRIVLAEGSGMELTSRGRTGILFAGYNFTSGAVSSGTMFATNNYEFAMSSKWELSDDSSYELLEIDMTDKDVIEGLRNGLEGVKEGEECYILFSGRHAFGKDKTGTIPANAPLCFRVWVSTVEN